MDNVTLGQVSNVLVWIVGFIGTISTIIMAIKKIIASQLKPLLNKIDKLDINQCRNYLVDFLADIEQGISKDETQIKRAYEVYDHYAELGGNSYIHDKWEKLMR